MSSETALRFRCPCGRTFDDEYRARQHAEESHAHRTAANDVHPVEVRVDDSSPTTLDEWGFQTAADRRAE
ncbi:hypothetical protein [Salinigranum marinum]|uniref:hypothetical protein n=1 Tax=Salinigranum marinum TaxID=1515595 RepID=UPI002989AACB|nr:hypothetical protein [Salinigranum marinum]